jgi:hypothetical protein
VSPTNSSPAEPPPPAQQPLLARSRDVLAAAESEGTPLRLLGGAGIRLLLGARMHPRFEREIADIDLITTRRGSRAVEQLLEREGFAPERQFNALNGARRLLFLDGETGRQVDVFVERFEMCHALPLSERLEVRGQTLPAAELAMSKLQIVELNEKDRDDLYALLATLEVCDGDFVAAGAASPRAGTAPSGAGETPESSVVAGAEDRRDAINATRIAALAAEDWGLHHTFELNLQRLEAEARRAGLPDELASLVVRRAAALREALERAPKSRAWKLRARIGERRRWYEEPEEVER